MRPSYNPTYIVTRGIKVYLSIYTNTLRAEAWFNEKEAERAVEILKPYALKRKNGNGYVVYID